MSLEILSDSEPQSQITQSSRSAFVENTNPAQWDRVKLPRFFILKGNNGNYLRAINNGETQRFSAYAKNGATVFESMPVRADQFNSVGIIGTSRGRLYLGAVIEGTQSGTFRASFASPENWRARFYPVYHPNEGSGSDGRHFIGLRLFQAGRGSYRCYSDDNGTLRYGQIQVRNNAGFEVEEAVNQRQIYGIQYRMNQAVISDHEPLTSVTKDVQNHTDTPQTGVLSFSHTDKESHSWGSTDTWKISSSVDISVRIPFVGGTDISTEAYYSGSYEWGEEQETAKEIGSQLEVEVPPMSMVQATMIVKKGKLTVPFSYTQRDNLYNGNSSLSTLSDGVFTAVNTVVNFVTTKKNLS